MKKTDRQPGRMISLCGLAVLFLGSITFAALPANYLKQILDNLSADGSIESLTISLIAAVNKA
ncbi:MAG: hypothetical protein JEZ00_21665 [Anaerolineaceae bacterium]|nr:hypothetical protein [Anaerolineaceae bacterium]